MVVDPGPDPAPEDSPWLSDAEQRVWRAFLQLTDGLNDLLDRQMQADAGMPHAYYLILAMLSEAPDRSLRMAQLAAAAWASPSRVSHAVDRLEALGWVVRRPDERDRRGQVASLTDDGFARLESAAPGHARTVRSVLFDALTPTQLATFGEVCDLALGRLGGAADPAAGAACGTPADSAAEDCTTPEG